MSRRGTALWRSRFVRSVSVVAGGAAVSQLITVVISPITSRQYGPEAYGVAGVFLSLYMILLPLAGLAYGHAIALPKDDRDALALLELAGRLSLLVAGILLACLLLAASEIADPTGFAGSPSLLVLLAPAILFGGLMIALGQWLIRNQRFKTLGSVDASQSLAVNGSRVAIGFVAPSAAALIVVATFGYLLNALLLFIGARGTLRPVWSARPDEMGSRRRAVARTYRDFPLYRAPQIILNASSFSLPVIMLAALFSPTVAGLYGLGRNVLALPAGLVSQSVGKVYLPHAIEIVQRGGDLRHLLVRATLSLGGIGILPFGLVIVAGPLLFGFVFGDEWTVAGEYARWLSLWSYFAFINAACVQTIPILGLQGRFLAYEGITTVLKALALVAGAVLVGTPSAAIILFSVAGAGTNVLLIASVLWASRRFRREDMRQEGSGPWTA